MASVASMVRPPFNVCVCDCVSVSFILISIAHGNDKTNCLVSLKSRNRIISASASSRKLPRASLKKRELSYVLARSKLVSLT